MPQVISWNLQPGPILPRLTPLSPEDHRQKQEFPSWAEFAGQQQIHCLLKTKFNALVFRDTSLSKQLPFLQYFPRSKCSYLVMVLSRVQLFATIWTIAHQASLSMKFSRQAYWSGLPFPPSEGLSNPGIHPAFLVFLVLAGRFFTTEPAGKPRYSHLVSPNSGWIRLCFPLLSDRGG